MGSTYTFIPTAGLERLGIAPARTRRFRLANDTVVEYPTSRARVRVNGYEEVTVVVFGGTDGAPLLGAHALQGLGLAPDPVNQRLIPVDALLKRVKTSLRRKGTTLEVGHQIRG